MTSAHWKHKVMHAGSWTAPNDSQLCCLSDGVTRRGVGWKLTVSLHGGDEVSVQEEVHVGQIGGGASVHHHVVQHLNATHAAAHRTDVTSSEPTQPRLLGESLSENHEHQYVNDCMKHMNE